MPLLVFALWAASLVSPIIAAIGCWRLAQRVRRGWIVHLLLAPGVLAVEYGLLSLLGDVAGDDATGASGTGLALIAMVVVLSLGGYYAGVFASASGHGASDAP